MTRALVALLLLSGCAQTYRAVTGQPPKAAPLFADFVVTSVALAASAYMYNHGQPVESMCWAGGGMLVALSANLAEGGR